MIELDNETILASYLTQLQANVREMARLDFERTHHKDYVPGEFMSEQRKGCIELWTKLSEQLWELLGLKLKTFSQLVDSGTFHNELSEPRCLRWNFKKLKKMADKHRWKNPGFEFLASWDLEAKRRLTENEKLRREVDEYRKKMGYGN